MHSKGHFGSMLLSYAPFAFILAYTHHYIFLIAGFLILSSATMLPDIDLKLPFVKHRGFTHTVWFGILIGIILSALSVAALYYVKMIPPVEKISIKIILFSFFIGNMVVLGHLVGDIITIMGIRPFKPISDKKIRIDSRFLPLPTRASSDLANSLLFYIGFFSTILCTGIALYLTLNIENGLFSKLLFL